MRLLPVVLSNIVFSIASTASYALYGSMTSSSSSSSSSSLVNVDKSVPDKISVSPTHNNKVRDDDDDEYRFHWELYPKSYGVHKLHHRHQQQQQRSLNDEKMSEIPIPAFDIDGNIEKDVWQNVPWSDSFGDIQGKDEPEPKNTIPVTAFKAIYDDSFLYIAALLHPAPGMATRVHYTQRNSPIYQLDSDFEVFIDVDHTNHMYKELEINAINTIWNLLLNKPYDDGGMEHSGRIATIGETQYYDVSRQHTATKIIAGVINDDSNNCTGALWSVEMALSYTDLLSNTTLLSSIPKYSPTGSVWRVNFSRVEKQGKINWTWQPQIRWNPVSRQYTGFVAMHMPDAWGYFYFSDDDYSSNSNSNSSSTLVHAYKDPLWPEKLTAMTIYYALHEYNNHNGHFTDSLFDLTLPPNIIAPFSCQIQIVPKQVNGDGFSIQVRKRSNSNSSSIVQVLDDRFLQVIPMTTWNEWIQ